MAPAGPHLPAADRARQLAPGRGRRSPGKIAVSADWRSLSARFAAETAILLIGRTLHWTPEQYGQWLVTTWTRLSGLG